MKKARKTKPTEKVKSEMLLCRMNHAEKELLRKAAGHYGLGMSYYIREVLLKEAAKELRYI